MARKKKIPTECKVFATNRYGKTTFTYYFEGIKTDGKKRNQISKGGFSSYEDAKKAGDAHLYEYYSGCKNEDNEPAEKLITFRDFVYNVWKPHKERTVVASTLEKYQKMLKNYVLPAIGDYPISSITTDMLQDIVDELYNEKKLSHDSVSNIHTLIQEIFLYAEEHEYIGHFHKRDFIVPRKYKDTVLLDSSNDDHNGQTRGPIPSDKLDQIFKRFPEGTPAFLIIAIALFTGARRGEASALAVEDCDFENNLIYLHTQFPDGKKYLKTPKDGSDRKVPMCPQLKAILLRAIERNKVNENVWGSNYQHTYLVEKKGPVGSGLYDISYEEGTPIHFFNVRENGEVIYPDTMKDASRIIHGYVPGKKEPDPDKIIYSEYNTHSLRNTYISFMDKEGVSDSVKSAVLGHKRTVGKDASRTTNTYIQVTDDRIQEICDIVDKIYTFK